MARPRAAAVSQRGRSPSRLRAITGASTDDTATMNAEREGVVITSPAVCAMNPTATRAEPGSRGERECGDAETYRQERERCRVRERALHRHEARAPQRGREQQCEVRLPPRHRALREVTRRP